MKAIITIPKNADFPKSMKESDWFRTKKFFLGDITGYGKEYMEATELQNPEAYLERIINGSNTYRDDGFLYAFKGDITFVFKLGLNSKEGYELTYQGYEKTQFSAHTENVMRMKNKNIGTGLATCDDNKSLTAMLEEYGNVHPGWHFQTDWKDNIHYDLLILENSVYFKTDRTMKILEEIRKRDEKIPVIVLCITPDQMERYKIEGGATDTVLIHDNYIPQLKRTVEKYIEEGDSNIFRLKDYELEFRREK